MPHPDICFLRHRVTIDLVCKRFKTLSSEAYFLYRAARYQYSGCDTPEPTPSQRILAQESTWKLKWQHHATSVDIMVVMAPDNDVRATGQSIKALKWHRSYGLLQSRYAA